MMGVIRCEYTTPNTKQARPLSHAVFSPTWTCWPSDAAMFTSASSEKMASDYRSGRVFEPCTLCGRCNHRACSQHGRTMTAADQYGESGKSPKRSEEHTSELQSLMRISYAVFCL